MAKTIEAKTEEQIVRIQKLVQLTQWVDGNCIHMNIEGNLHCCPDMSCCFPHLQAPKPFRKIYRKAFTYGEENLKMELYNTFTQYFCDSENFAAAQPAKYYTDWMKDTSRFNYFEKLCIRFSMWRKGVKY